MVNILKIWFIQILISKSILYNIRSHSRFTTVKSYVVTQLQQHFQKVQK